MAVDTSIYGNLLRPPKSVAEYDMEAEARKANKLQNMLGQAKLGEYNRGVERSNKLASLLQSGADAAGLRQGGFLDEASNWEKNAADVAKTKADTVKSEADADKQRIASGLQKIEIAGQLMNGVTDQASYDLARQKAAEMLGPEIAQKMPPVFDPRQVEQGRQQAMSVKDRLEQEWKAKRYDLDVRQQGEVERNNRAQTSVAQANVGLRRQELDLSRSRESAAVSKPFEVTGPDGLPILVRQDKQGNISPVEGYGPKTGASKPLNDTQAKALLFGSRMQEADKILETLTGKYSPAAVNAKVAAGEAPLIGGAAGMIGNALLSEEGQQAEQAQRDFINAVLRRESGAVISAPEFANAAKQYFPQPNDKPATLEQKKKNRQLAIRGLLAEVPDGRRNSITTQPADGLSPEEQSELEVLRKRFQKQ